MIFYLIFYRIYLLGIAVFFINTFARAVFGELKLRKVPAMLFASAFWILFLFSKRGRKKLIGKIRKL